MKFIFKAKDQQGKVREGKVEALSHEKAVKIIEENGMTPVYVLDENKQSKWLLDLAEVLEGATQKELMIIFRELSTLISARVPIVSSINAIADQSENRFLKSVLKELAGDISEGMTISEAMGKHPRVFSPFVVSMTKAGEISGNLQKSIDFVADNIEKNYQLTSKIKGALFYPVFVIGAAAIFGFVAVTFILPKLMGVFTDMQIDIPWYTKILMGLSTFMQSYWWAVLIIVIGGAASAIYYLRTEAGRKEWHRVQLGLPIVGKLYTSLYVARFARNFSVLLTGGIPIVHSLAVVADVVNNSVFRALIIRAADEVKTGGNVSDVFARSNVMPPILTRVLKIGEETGKTSEVLQSIAGFYETETDNMAKNLASLIEPVMIVGLGIGVAILVFAILLPIYDIANKI